MRELIFNIYILGLGILGLGAECCSLQQVGGGAPRSAEEEATGFAGKEGRLFGCRGEGYR